MHVVAGILIVEHQGSGDDLAFEVDEVEGSEGLLELGAEVFFGVGGETSACGDEFLEGD